MILLTYNELEFMLDCHVSSINIMTVHDNEEIT